MSVAPPSGPNRIMIYGPKPDGTYIVEFRIANGELESDYAATADAGSNEAVTAQRVNLDPKCALNRWPPATSSAAVSAHRHAEPDR
jgi:hypothetical protein